MTEVARAGRALPDEVAAELGTQIRSGALAVGSRLPSERELCARYGVSRAVVREALSRLKSEGLVLARAGSGVYVTELDEDLSFRMSPVAPDEQDSFAQILELLVCVEAGAARIAARRRTEADLKRIRRALIGMEYAIVSDELGDNEDFAFHQAITDATHNPHFQSLCRYLESGSRNVIRQARTNTRAHFAPLLDAVQEEHEAIYAALKAGDPDAAAAAAERHLRSAAVRLQTYISDAGGAGPLNE